MRDHLVAPRLLVDLHESVVRVTPQIRCRLLLQRFHALPLLLRDAPRQHHHENQSQSSVEVAFQLEVDFGEEFAEDVLAVFFEDVVELVVLRVERLRLELFVYLVEGVVFKQLFESRVENLLALVFVNDTDELL